MPSASRLAASLSFCCPDTLGTKVFQSGRRDKTDGQTRTSHGWVRTTWLPPVSSHLASAGAGPERYAAVVNPPVGGSVKLFQIFIQASSPEPGLTMRREKWAALFLGYLRRKIITANGSDVITPVFATQP